MNTHPLKQLSDDSLYSCNHIPENAGITMHDRIISISGHQFVLCSTCWKALAYDMVTEFNRDSQTYINVYNTLNK